MNGSNLSLPRGRGAWHFGLAWANDGLAASRFEALASRVLAVHYAVVLSPGSVPGVRKRFDFA